MHIQVIKLADETCLTHQKVIQVTQIHSLGHLTHLTLRLTVDTIITTHQYGFIPGRSYTSQLLVALNNWTKALEDGYFVDILYSDMAKAL